METENNSTSLVNDIINELKHLEPLRGVTDKLVIDEVIESMTLARNEFCIAFERIRSTPDRIKIPDLCERIMYKIKNLNGFFENHDPNIELLGNQYQIKEYPIDSSLAQKIFDTNIIGDIENLAQIENWDEMNIYVNNFYRYTSEELFNREFCEECGVDLVLNYLMIYLRRADKTNIKLSEMKEYLYASTKAPVSALYDYAENIFCTSSEIINQMYEFDRRKLEYVVNSFKDESDRAYLETNNSLVDIAQTFIKSCYVKTCLIHYIYSVVIKFCSEVINLNLILIDDINRSIMKYYETNKS